MTYKCEALLKQNIFYSLFICIFFFLTLLAVSYHGKNSRSLPLQSVVIGVGVPEIVIVDHQKEVYHVWKERRMHGRAVVHFDIAMDTKAFKEAELKIAYGVYIGLEREDRIDNDNFMFYSMWDGIIRRIIGVVPERIYLTAGEDLIKFRYYDYGGYYRGSFAGIPKIVTILKGLSTIEEPVLLDFDAKFFSDPGIVPKAVFDRLKILNIKTDLVTFSLSREEKDVSPDGVEKMKEFIGLLKGI